LEAAASASGDPWVICGPDSFILERRVRKGGSLAGIACELDVSRSDCPAKRRLRNGTTARAMARSAVHGLPVWRRLGQRPAA
jgi:hypothetical protein